MDILDQSYTYGASFLRPESRQTPLSAYLTGSNISASLSPTILGHLFTSSKLPWKYGLIQTNDPQESLRILHKADTIGMSITMPYKITFMSLLDDLMPSVRAIGAVNTVFKRIDSEGKTRYIGANTDCIGIRETLKTVPGLMEKARGKPALVIGSGGAARSAIYALWTWYQPREIYIVNRLKSEVEDLSKAMRDSVPGIILRHIETLLEADAVEAPAIIIGTVPDYPPQTPEEIRTQDICYYLVRRTGALGGTVLDMCYMPSPWTRLCKVAEKAGCTIVLGSIVLVQVCAAQHMLWSEGPVDKRGLGEMMEKMRGSGKGTESIRSRM